VQFLLDECLSPQGLNPLHKSGYAAYHVGYIGRGGCSDEEQFDYALQYDLVFLTKNVKDFAKLRNNNTNAHHNGLVYFTDGDLTVAEQIVAIDALLMFIGSNNIVDMMNAVIEVDGNNQCQILP